MTHMRGYVLGRVQRFKELRLELPQVVYAVSQLVVDLKHSGWRPRDWRRLYYSLRGVADHTTLSVMRVAIRQQFK